jgi:parallel beta-helix repeat protein
MTFNSSALILAVLLAGSINLLANPYPTEVMKWAESEKTKQRKAGAEILKKIHDAAKKGDKSVDIPKGVYRFTETTIPHQPTHIELRDIKNFSIEGNDSWFYFEKQASAFKIAQCSNLIIRNLNIDYDPLPYVQGTVVSINDKAKPRTFVFKPDPGYKMPELMTQTPSWTTAPKSTSRVLLWDKNTLLIKPDQYGMDIPKHSDAIKKLDNGNYEIKTWVWWGRSLIECGFEPGDKVTLWTRAGRTIRIEVCGKVTLDNVDVYAGGFVAYVGYFGDGPFTFRNCDVKRRPGASRLMSNNADGFNIRGTLKGVVIENCSADSIGDDAVNLQGVYYKVFEQISPTELIVAATMPNDGKTSVWHFISGDSWTDKNRPKAKNMRSWGYIGKRKVLEKTSVRYTIPEGRKFHEWSAAARYKPGKTYPAMKVTLDRSIKVDLNSVFWSENSIVRGSVIRNNIFHNILARGIRLQTIDCLVEDNRISYTTGAGITFAGQPGYWGESANCQNITVKNNVFEKNVRSRGNAAVVMVVEGDPQKAEPISNIIFENNKIISPRGSGIELSGCKDVKIIGNTISGARDMPYMKQYSPNQFVDPNTYGQPIVRGKALTNVTIENNTIK